MVAVLGYAVALLFAVWAACTLSVLAYLFGWDDGYEQGWDTAIRERDHELNRAVVP